MRTRKALIVQAGLLLVSAALIGLLWPAGGLQDVGGAQARRLLSVLAIGELLMVVLFAPAFTAASLTGEKEHNTLELLFATPLKPWQIATGKMVGSLASLMLFIIGASPALAAVVMLGQIGIGDVLGVVGILMLTAVYLGMIGMLVSSMMHRSYRAIIVTYAILGAICFLFALPAWPISRNLLMRGSSQWQAAFHVLASLSPVEAMLSLVWPASTYTTGAKHLPPFHVMFVPLSCGVILISAVACLLRLRKPPQPPRPREKLKVVERGKFTHRTLLFIIDPRKRKRMIAWWQNPVLIKEFRSRPMLQAHWLLRLIGISLILAIALMFLVNLSVMAFMGETTDMSRSMAGAIGVLMVVIILMIGPAMTGGCICADRETGVWDLLRATRLSSWRTVSGKFQAVIIPLVLVVLAMLPALIVLIYFDNNLAAAVMRISCVVGMTVLLVGCAGMFFSSLAPRTALATAWTYALLVSTGLVTLLVLLGENIFSQRFIAGVFSVNPIAAALDAAGATVMRKYSVMAQYMKIAAVTIAIMFVVTVLRVFRLRRAS